MGAPSSATVAPARELGRPRVREAVPVLVHDRVEEAVCAREVDDDAARRRLDRRGLLVRQAEKGHVRAAGEGRVVRNEARHPATAVAVETGVERGRVASGERIRPDGMQLELGMPEHAIERLLAGVPGAADDADRAICIVCLNECSICRWVPIRLRHAMHIRLVDTRAHDAYLAGHIPGAAHLDPERDLTGEIGDASAAPSAPRDERSCRRRFGRAGIDPETFVLAYDEGTGWAARCWWLLRHLGHAAAGTFDLRSIAGRWRPERVPCRESPQASAPRPHRRRDRGGGDPCPLEDRHSSCSMPAPGRAGGGDEEALDPVAGRIPARATPSSRSRCPPGRSIRRRSPSTAGPE